MEPTPFRGISNSCAALFLYHNYFFFFFLMVCWCTTTTQAAAVNDTLHWGTYRSNLYFGVRSRSPESPLIGLMWFDAHNPLTVEELRHSCEESDGLDSYGWTRHDGTNFGEQVLVDPKTKVKLTTTFLKRGERGEEWAARISGQPLSKVNDEAAISLFFYIALPDTYTLSIGELNGVLSKKKGLPEDIQIQGRTGELGPFSLSIRNAKENTSPSNSKSQFKIKQLADLKKTHFFGYSSSTHDMWNVKQKIQPILLQDRQRIFSQYLTLHQKDSTQKPSPFLFLPTLPNSVKKDSNVVVIQRIVKLPFEVDMAFLPHKATRNVESSKADRTKKSTSLGSHQKLTNAEIQSRALSGSEFTVAVNQQKQEFEKRFEEIFGLAAKGFDVQQQNFAMSTMSNLIGGISYFHGKAIVQRYTAENLLSGTTLTRPMSLYSAVPSRPFFPRGFLWDEGFHQLLVCQWSPLITRDVLRHWFSLQDQQGWIAREQILGEEARSKVPAEFQAQNPAHANPPTLLFPLSSSIRAVKEAQESNSTGKMEGGDSLLSFGIAQPTDVLEEMAFLKEMFPRLAKWYQWFSNTQRSKNQKSFMWVGRTVNHTLTSGLDDYPRASTPSENEEHIDLVSWMMFYSRMMVDIAQLVGEDSDFYARTYHQLETQLEAYWSQDHGCYCDIEGRDPTTGAPKLVCHKGYVSLFPLLLGLVPTHSPNLDALLNLMRDENHLWSGYGLRSLSKLDHYFGQGENYWKGPIWINLNYLALSALKNYYASRPGPYQDKAQALYNELRNQLVSNMYNEYVRTGYVWEQYNPITGQGQRSHPFTGWSALIVLIMAEQYPEKYT